MALISFLRSLTVKPQSSCPKRQTSSWRVCRAMLKTAASYHEAVDLSGLLETSKSVVFYTHANCPYAHRVWMTLLEKKVDHDLVHVDLSVKPYWFLRLNPAGLVPVLCHDGNVYIESLDISKYVDEAFDGPSLMPSDRKQNQIAQTMLKKTSQYVEPGLSLIGGADGRWAIGRHINEAGTPAFEEAVDKLAMQLEQSGGPFLFGISPTLVDFALFPFYERFRLVLDSFFDYKIQSKELLKWLAAVRHLKLSSISTSDESLLKKAYQRHKRLDFFDYTTYGLASLHPHLTVE